MTKTALLVLGFLLVGCAAGDGSRSGDGRMERRITETELATTNARNAYEAIQRLRPAWLGRMQQARIYIDDVVSGIPLTSVHISEIQEIEFLTSADATTRYGTNHVGGAIVVRRK